MENEEKMNAQKNDLSVEQLDFSELEQVSGGKITGGCGITNGKCDGEGAGCGGFNGKCNLQPSFEDGPREIP